MPDKLKEMQGLFYSEAKKYDVLPLDNRRSRVGTRRAQSHGGAIHLHVFGRTERCACQRCPEHPEQGYTITAEVEIRDGGMELIVTEGGRFGGYGCC